MSKNLLSVLLADNDEEEWLFFKDAFEKLKIKTQVEFVHDGVELMKYLTQPDIILPDILFLDLNIPKKAEHECLVEIKNNDNLKNLIVAIYSTSASEEDIEDTFVKGANIYIKKPHDADSLKKIISYVMSLNWQYHTTGLNRENFLLRL
ncbi:MAG: response regulator [Flavobacterium sp.]